VCVLAFFFSGAAALFDKSWSASLSFCCYVHSFFCHFQDLLSCNTLSQPTLTFIAQRRVKIAPELLHLNCYLLGLLAACIKLISKFHHVAVDKYHNIW